jgi:hypothetical protein
MENTEGKVSGYRAKVTKVGAAVVLMPQNCPARRENLVPPVHPLLQSARLMGTSFGV